MFLLISEANAWNVQNLLRVIKIFFIPEEEF